MAAPTAPPFFVLKGEGASGGCLGRLDLLGRARLGACNGNAARLHVLGQVAHESDMEQAVLQHSAGDLNMVGELEAALEGTRSNAARKDVRSRAVLLLALLALEVLTRF